MDIDALLHAQDLLFYDTFPDAVPKPSDTDVQVAHINAYCPPESQPLLAYAAEYVYPNPVDSWAFYQPDLICPPRLALDLPTYDDYPFPPSATTPVSPYATFDDPSQSPPSSAVSTHSSVSVFADGSEPSTEGFCESPTAIMGPPPLDDLVPIARKRDDIVRRPVKRRSSSKPSASERRASTSARKRDTSKDKDKDKKPPLACLFCRGRKIACGPPLKGLGMAMDACK
ncbi:hypothetical protein C8F01DRAFT_1181791 [Mycena amicta]|nr:hypothetical protein C8F01DRAFT_1181791 [Mycena amicta]